MKDLIIHEFRPVRLTLDRVGPFQESLYSIDLTDKQDTPCNFFMIIAANGYGKTTILEAIACAMRMLMKSSSDQSFKYGMEDLDQGGGRIQLDFSMRCHWLGENRRVIFSIHAGHFGSDEISLETWQSIDSGGEKLKRADAEQWCRAGFMGKSAKAFSSNNSDPLVQALIDIINDHQNLSPDDFNQSAIFVPTVLSFPAYRDIPRITDNPSQHSIAKPAHWDYQSLHKFSAHNETWSYSLDSLLVWLKWLDDGRFEKAQDLINEQVFKGTNKYLEGIQRDPPQAVVKANGQTHRLDQLSSGEKNIAQLMLRIGAHMTQNTLILIDEFDVHLHIRWQYRLFEALKSLAARKDVNVTVILTTHSVEVLDTYINRMNIDEEGLVKGGHLIDKGLK